MVQEDIDRHRSTLGSGGDQVRTEYTDTDTDTADDESQEKGYFIRKLGGIDARLRLATIKRSKNCEGDTDNLKGEAKGK